jgi:hypothetical protein
LKDKALKEFLPKETQHLNKAIKETKLRIFFVPFIALVGED